MWPHCKGRAFLWPSFIRCIQGVDISFPMAISFLTITSTTSWIFLSFLPCYQFRVYQLFFKDKFIISDSFKNCIFKPCILLKSVSWQVRHNRQDSTIGWLKLPAIPQAQSIIPWGVGGNRQSIQYCQDEVKSYLPWVRLRQASTVHSSKICWNAFSISPLSHQTRHKVKK